MLQEHTVKTVEIIVVAVKCVNVVTMHHVHVNVKDQDVKTAEDVK